MPHKLNGKIEIVGAVQKGYIKCHFEPPHMHSIIENDNFY